MKKIISSFSLICFAIFFACKKKPFDYRSKYYGKYNCTVHATFWLMGQGIVKDTNYSYTLEVKKGGGYDNIIIGETEMSLNEDGSFGYDYRMYGEFETTKKLKYISSGGGLGGQSNYTVIGERTK